MVAGCSAGVVADTQPRAAPAGTASPSPVVQFTTAVPRYPTTRPSGARSSSPAPERCTTPPTTACTVPPGSATATAAGWLSFTRRKSGPPDNGWNASPTANHARGTLLDPIGETAAAMEVMTFGD